MNDTAYKKLIAQHAEARIALYLHRVEFNKAALAFADLQDALENELYKRQKAGEPMPEVK